MRYRQYTSCRRNSVVSDKHGTIMKRTVLEKDVLYQKLIDVGINRNPETGKICGDVHPNVAETCSLTPVPKGVGLLTVAALMENTVRV